MNADVTAIKQYFIYFSTENIGWKCVNGYALKYEEEQLSKCKSCWIQIPSQPLKKIKVICYVNRDVYKVKHPKKRIILSITMGKMKAGGGIRKKR